MKNRCSSVGFCARWALVLALGACFGGAPDGAHDPALYRMIYSPNGEPLNGGPLGQVRCDDALSGWFARLDPQGTGVIDKAVYMADAQKQFDRMDLDKDGALTSAELESFRKLYRQDMPRRLLHHNVEDLHDRRGRGGSEPRTQNAPEADVLDDAADPVMAADANLDFRVTRAEYKAYAEKTYADFARRQKDGPDLQAFLRLCPKR